MASLFTHPFIPIGLKLAGQRPSPRFFWLLVILSILPDADVVAFRFGIPYESQWGHRGFTHSIAFALGIGLLCQFFAHRLGASRVRVFVLSTLVTFSHGLLDALTTGGLGVAFFWPLTPERFFLPWQLIAVSPLGVGAFFSRRGLVVLASEILWVWLPTILLSYLVRRRRRKI
jgi:inner membrane protein